MVGWEPFLFAWTAGNNVVRALPTETISISDTLQPRITNKKRTRSEVAIAISDGTVITQRTKNRILATQTTLVSDLAVRVRGFTKTLNDTTTIGSELLGRLNTKVRALPTQTTLVSDLATRVIPILRTITEAGITISDTLQPRVKGAWRRISSQDIITPQSYTATSFTESYTTEIIEQPIIVSDTLSRIKTMFRIILQEVLITDSLSRVKSGQTAAARGFIESTPISETAVPSRSKWRQILDSATPGETFSGVSFTSLSFHTQTAEISDNVARGRGILKTLIENTAISEILTMTGGVISRVISQTVVIGEIITRQLTKSRTLSQSLTISEDLIRLQAKLRTIVQTTLISDAVDMVLKIEGQVVKTITDTVGEISDSIERQTEKSRSMEEDENTFVDDILELLYTAFVPKFEHVKQRKITRAFSHFPRKTTRPIWRF